tara:strand:+ start:558 stop:737 length:180 start_codon:yes stop_codon:yes gene_type:complete
MDYLWQCKTTGECIDLADHIIELSETSKMEHYKEAFRNLDTINEEIKEIKKYLLVQINS